MTTEPGRLRVKCKWCGGTFVSMGVFRDDSVINQYESCHHCWMFNQLPLGVFKDLKQKEPKQSRPRNVHFTKAKPYFNVQSERIFLLQSRRLMEPAVAFTNNVTRLHALMELPTNVAWLSRLLHEIDRESRAATNGSRAKLAKEFVARWSKWFEENRGQKRIDHIAAYGEGTLRKLADPVLSMAMEALLVSQITGVWTAFETLAGDLWKVALNVHPKTLAAMNGARNRIIKKSHKGEEPRSENVNSKVILKPSDIDEITKGTFAIQGMMGDMLKSQVSFATLDQIRVTYAATFSKHASTIDGVLSRKSLDVLCAVRNLIVHKAGIVDDKYRIRVRGLKGAPLAATDSPLRLDGPKVHAMIGPVVQAGIELITAVDNWVTQH